MVILDIFSKRQRALRGGFPDVYEYDTIPSELRVQIVQLCVATLGEGYPGQPEPQLAYQAIVEALRREYGVFLLPSTQRHNHPSHAEELANFILSEVDTERVLDAVELVFRVIDSSTRDYSYLGRPNASAQADEAIEELNIRFKEHGVGFEYVDKQIIRIDSEYVHAELVKPALRILSDKKYAGARQEFLSAHTHYRAGETKECINDCLKAFESIMKSICDRRGWKYQSAATAKDLIQACFDNNLIPAFWQSNFASLRSSLESGIPTGRNKLSGHGQGAAPIEVPMHLAAYLLHMTAAVIVFLDEADSAL